MKETNKAQYFKEQMEFYFFLAMKEKEINRDKYLYYLAKADNYKKLLEKAEEVGSNA